MDKKSINIIFPNQLFKQSKIIQNNYPTFLIEEDNFLNELHTMGNLEIDFSRNKIKKLSNNFLNRSSIL